MTIKVAIMYDFDKTLSPKDMQEFGFIESLNLKPESFWAEVNEFCLSNKMDKILGYMYMMLHKAKATKIPIRRNDFVQLGKAIELYDGVSTWFERINEYGKKLGIEIEHYIISSGLKEVIEGTSISQNFKEIYACEYYYDENGVAVWPKTNVNYTAKTQYLFRINKGVFDVNDDKGLNEYTKEEDRYLPFSNMIYLGDGLTDVPSMKLVKINGGYSIVVYKPKNNKNRELAKQLCLDQRVDYIAPANYVENSKLDKIVKAIIDNIAIKSQLDKLKG